MGGRSRQADGARQIAQRHAVALGQFVEQSERANQGLHPAQGAFFQLLATVGHICILSVRAISMQHAPAFQLV